MFVLEGKWHRKFKYATLGLIIIAIPIGIPLVGLYRPNFVFDWYSYVFLLFHAAYFIATFFLVTFFFEFANKNYFSLVPEKQYKTIRKLWNRLQIGAFVFFLLLFGMVAFHDWNRYLTDQAMHEATPTDNTQYGSLFTFGPWGWVLFAVFIIMGAILMNAVFTVFFTLVCVKKFGHNTSLIPIERWRDWSKNFLIYLIWLILFTLPFSLSSGQVLTIFYVLFLSGPTIGYLIFLYSTTLLSYRKPETIQEFIEARKEEFKTMKKINLAKNAGIILASLMFVLLVNRYLSTPQRFLNNPILLTIASLIIIGGAAFDYWATQIEEKNLTEIEPKSTSTTKIKPNKLHTILTFRFAHFYILSFLENNSPADLKTLRKTYPNSPTNLRTSLDFLVQNNLVDKKPHLQNMNRKRLEITPEGMNILNDIKAYLNS